MNLFIMLSLLVSILISLLILILLYFKLHDFEKIKYELIIAIFINFVIAFVAFTQKFHTIGAIAISLGLLLSALYISIENQSFTYNTILLFIIFIGVIYFSIFAWNVYYTFLIIQSVNQVRQNLDGQIRNAILDLNVSLIRYNYNNSVIRITERLRLLSNQTPIPYERLQLYINDVLPILPLHNIDVRNYSDTLLEILNRATNDALPIN